MKVAGNNIEEFYTLGLEVVFNFTRYFVPAGFLFFLFYVGFKKFFYKWKIQKAYPERGQLWWEIVYSTITLLIFCAAAWLVFTLKATGWTQIYLRVADYGWLYFFFSFLVVVFVHDTYFYWTHRLLHHPKLFKIAHLTHHRSHNPTPWSAFSFHPIEAIINALFLPIIVVVLPLHPIIIFSFMLLMTLVNIMGHSGFEFFPKKFMKNKMGKWQNVATNHNYHHEHSDGNFGLYFTFWDRWMGTFRG